MVAVLTQRLIFPSPERANPHGLVAVGGDLSCERLLLAYSEGIFPWPSPGMPLLWFSPDPRAVLVPEKLHVPRSLRKAMRRSPCRLSLDEAFAEVIAGCAQTPRADGHGTWITAELSTAYQQLHRAGFAHSVEVWLGDALVGGLYGVALGSAFFGESMFSLGHDASKLAVVALALHARRWGLQFIDCQVESQHMQRFGAEKWSRRRFLRDLRDAIAKPGPQGAWQLELSLAEMSRSHAD